MLFIYYNLKHWTVIWTLTSRKAKFLSWLICTARTGLLGACESPARRIWALKNSAMDSWGDRNQTWGAAPAGLFGTNQRPREYLSHSKRDVANVEAPGLSRHLTANYGHLCRGCSYSSSGGRCQQSYCWNLAGRWGNTKEGQCLLPNSCTQTPLLMCFRDNIPQSDCRATNT